MGKKQNGRAPVRITVDLDSKDYAALEQVTGALRAMSKAEAMRRLIRYASANPQMLHSNKV